MWLLIFGVTFAALIAGIIYMIFAIGRFPFIKKVTKDRKVFKILLSFGIIAIFMAIGTILSSFLNATIIFLQLMLFFLFYTFIGWIIKKCFKKEYSFYWQGWFSIITCVIYFIVAYFLCKNVWLTEYSFVTTKNVGSIRIALIADSHVGTTFDGDGFAEKLEQIEAQNPDALLIAGDFVDDGTSREDMVRACQALGKFEAKYGVWYCFGNHDRGYYRDPEDGFTGEDLVAELEKNNVHVMVDDYKLIDDRFYIVGREDASANRAWRSENVQTSDSEKTAPEQTSKDSGSGSVLPEKVGRMSAQDLIGELDSDKYIIVMDHQPNDYKNESQTAADLVLSGHTHGGQLLPINRIGELFGVNDRTYGHENINGTDFIVTSGISDWEVIFKTGTKSEYVIINIIGK